jgi:large subunit ribosomal protein L5
MQNIRIEKVTLNIGAGTSQDKLEKATKLLASLTGSKPVQTKSSKRIPTWGVRPGLKIGCKVTLRKKKTELLTSLFAAVNNRINASKFSNGTFSFGVPEHIDIPGVKYDPEIGILGLDVAITLERPGFRIKRKKAPRKISKKHLITKEEAIAFVKDKFKVEVLD